MTWMIEHPFQSVLLLLFEYVALMKWASFVYDKPLLLKMSKLTLIPVFLIQDWIVNMMMSFWFLDPPGHPTEVVTQRMVRYKKKYGFVANKLLTPLERWRKRHGFFLCRVLNKFAFRGDHC